MGLPEFLLPEDKLPACWSDDVRMNALFAPFRIKSANPESWDMKMKFWSDMLRQWCKIKKDPLVSASDAKFAFQRKGRTPACIDIVVEEMLRNGELSPISKYTQILHNGPESWVKWGARLALKPAAIALTAAASLLPARQALDNDGLPKASIDPTHRFVLESAVKEQATALLENYPAHEDRVGAVEDLMRRCGWQRNKETFEVLLGWLVAQGAASKKDDVIKLAEANKKVSAVTESDEALVKLMAAETRLSGDAARMEREVSSCEAEARAALQMGNRAAAKNHLRRKHKAQQRFERCMDTLEHVRQLLVQLKEMDSNAAIVDTYRTSSQAMKRNMKENGLDEDAVHETMDDLKEVLNTYSEIESAISFTNEEFDAADLEQELKDLLASPTTKDKHRPEPVSSPRGADKEFIFDGEERMMAELAELDKLDLDAKTDEQVDKRTDKSKKKVAVAADWNAQEVQCERGNTTPKAAKSWYPPSNQFLNTWNNNPDLTEVRQEDRLHPGQPLQVDFTTPPRLYSGDFQVRDHKMAGGVWLYNKDGNSNVNDLSASTEYFSTESPGKAGGSFQMAPGGERKTSAPWASDEAPAETPAEAPAEAPTSSTTTVDDLERRLRDLRGFL